MKKAPSGTTRGVFVVDKSGKVLAAEPGGPPATVEVVRKLVDGSAEDEVMQEDDAEAAKTADEVADSAAKVDSA